jgi:hypothetical protein
MESMDQRITTESGTDIVLDKGAAGWFLSIERGGVEVSASLSREDKKRLIAALVESL